MFGIQKKAEEKTATANSVTYLPAVDVAENDNGYTIYADVPGVNKDGVSITYENGVLTLRAEAEAAKTEKTGEVLRSEFRLASYERSFRVGDDVDSDAISAEIANGVLKVALPRKASARKTISIK